MPQTPFGFFASNTSDVKDSVKSTIAASSENPNSICTFADPAGRTIKKSRASITETGVLNADAIRIGGSYSFPTSIGTPGQILVVPSLGEELKFLNVDPSPIEVDDLQSKTQNISLPATTPGETAFIGGISAGGGFSVGSSDAPDAWSLAPGHGEQGDQLLFPGGDSTSAYWGTAPSITVLQSKTQNIDFNLTSPTRTEFIGRVNAEDGFTLGTAPNSWSIPIAKGTATGQQMLWNNANNETTWGEAPAITDLKTKTQNIYAGSAGVSTSFDGAVRADNGFLVGESPNDWKIATARGVEGDSLVWPETGSTPYWSVPPSVRTLQDQCTHITSLPQTTTIASNLSAESIESRSTILVDSANPTGSYFLPYARGTPGQVLTAAGVNGSECAFQDNVLTPNEADSLLEKTQFQSADLTGTTFMGQLTATQHLVAPLVSAGHSMQVNSDSLTGSYILPLNRGTPGQVLVAAGDEGESCEFQDAVVTPTDLSNLETKTQNFQLSTVPNNTICVGTLAASTLAANFLSASGRVTISPSIDPVAVEVGLTGSMGTGYSLPRARGLEGQGLIQGTLGTVQFTDVADPAELETVLTRTQYQSTTPDQDRLTTFDGRLRLQPIPGGADKQVIFPDYRDNYGGSTLRTNSNLNQAELVWQFPSFIRRYINSNLGVTKLFEVQLTELGVLYGIMSFLTQEQTSTTPTFQFANSGVAYLGSSTQAMYRVAFSARIGTSVNPAPFKFATYLQFRANGSSPPNFANGRSWVVRKDQDPQYIHLEYYGAGLAPNNQLNIAIYATELGTLDFYDASFTVTVY